MNNIPYISHFVEVLQITDTKIRYLVVRKQFGNINVLNTEEFTIDGNDLEAALDQLNQRVKINNRNLYIILPNSNFIYILLDNPDIDDQEELDEWISENVKHAQENVKKLSRFTYTEINNDDEKKILVTFINNDIIEIYERTFQNYNLNPVFMGSELDALGYSLLYDENLFKSRSAFIVKNEEKSLILNYQKGTLTDFHELPNKNFNLSNLINYDDYLLANSEESDINYDIWQIDSFGCSNITKDHEDETNITEIEFFNENLSSDYLPLIGLLQSALYKIPSSLNFALKNIIRRSQALFEKKRTLSLIQIIIVLLGFFIIITQGLLWKFKSKNLNLDDVLQHIDDKVQIIDQKQEQIKSLKLIIQNTVNVNQDSTYFTGYLNIIAKAVSKDLWYEKLEITYTDNEYLISLYGFSYKQEKIAILLDSFEDSPYFQDLTLNYIETATNIEKNKLEINDTQDLYKFELNLRNQ